MKSPRGSDCPVCGKHYQKYNSMIVHKNRTHLPGPVGGFSGRKSGNSLTNHQGRGRGPDRLPDWYFKPYSVSVPELWKWLSSLEEGKASEKLIAHFLVETAARMDNLLYIMDGDQSAGPDKNAGRELTPEENAEYENLIDQDDFLRGKVMRQGNPFYLPWLARVVKKHYWGGKRDIP